VPLNLTFALGQCGSQIEFLVGKEVVVIASAKQTVVLAPPNDDVGSTGRFRIGPHRAVVEFDAVEDRAGIRGVEIAFEKRQAIPAVADDEAEAARIALHAHICWVNVFQAEPASAPRPAIFRHAAKPFLPARRADRFACVHAHPKDRNPDAGRSRSHFHRLFLVVMPSSIRVESAGCAGVVVMPSTHGLDFGPRTEWTSVFGAAAGDYSFRGALHIAQK